MEYHDFRIEISEIDGSRLRIAHENQRGQTVAAEVDDPAETRRHADQLKARKLPDVRSGELGRRLGQILMAGDVGAEFLRLRERQGDQGIRVVLQLNSEGLELIPWEAAHLPAKEGSLIQLGVDHTLSMVRQGPPGPTHFQSTDVDVFKVLVVDVGDVTPQGGEPLAIPDTTAEITANLPDASFFCMSERVTWSAVLDELDRGFESERAGSGTDYSVLHIRAHGSAHDPALWFASGDGAEAVSARQICSQLARAGLSLLIVTSCQAGSGHEWAGLGSAAIAAGLPATVSMQGRLEEGAASIFSQAVLERLSDGSSIDEAVSVGRQAVKARALLPDSWNPMLHAHEPDRILFGSGAELGATSTLQTQNAGAALRRYNNLSEADTGIVRRSDHLQPLLDKLSFSQTPLRVVLAGMGGVGKTQVARLFAAECFGSEMVQNVLEIKAEESTLMASALADLANHTPEITAGRSDVETAKNAVEWLGRQQRNSWLLFYDNAPSFSSVREFLPGGEVPFVITSRQAKWPARIATQPIGPMSDDEGVGLLLDRLDEDGADKDEARDLVAELGGLPLAIAQAAAYMNESFMGISEYRTMLERHPLRMLQRGRSDEAVEDEQADVRVTPVVLSSIERLDDTAHRLLRACAWLDPDGVPATVLGSSTSLTHLGIQDNLDFRDAIAALGDLWLMQGAEGRLSVHRLVQAIARRVDLDTYDGEGRSIAAKCIADAVAASKPIRLPTELASQLDVLSRHILHGGADEPEAIEVMVLAADYHRTQTADGELSSELTEAAVARATPGTETYAMALMQRYQTLDRFHSTPHAVDQTETAVLELLPHLSDSPYLAFFKAQQIRAAWRHRRPVSTDDLLAVIEASDRGQPSGSRLRASTLHLHCFSLRQYDHHEELLATMERLDAELATTGFLREQSYTRSQMAMAAGALGSYSQAADLVRESAKMLTAGGEASSFDQAIRLNNLAFYEYLLGNFDEANDAITRSVEHDRRLGGREATLSLRLGNQGRILAALGDFDGADRVFAECIDLARNHDDERLWMRLRYAGFAELQKHRALADSDAAGAERALEKALRVLSEADAVRPGFVQEMSGQVQLLGLLGVARARNGDKEGATQLLEEATEYLVPHIAERSLAMSHLFLAEAEVALLDRDLDRCTDFALRAVDVAEASAGPRCPLVTEAIFYLQAAAHTVAAAADEVIRLGTLRP